jgi:hypothetical protein
MLTRSLLIAVFKFHEMLLTLCSSFEFSGAVYSTVPYRILPRAGGGGGGGGGGAAKNII